MPRFNTNLVGTIACTVCALVALPGCQDPKAGPPWDFDSGQSDAMDQSDAGVDADSTTTRDAFPFDLPEPPNIDAGDWMPSGASEECSPRPEAEGRCYSRLVPRFPVNPSIYPGARSVCRHVQYQRIQDGPINSFRQYRVDRNECGEPVRVLDDIDSWQDRQDGEPLDGLPSWSRGYIYGSDGQLDRISDRRVDYQSYHLFNDKERLTQIESGEPDARDQVTSFAYDSLGNRTKSGDTEMSYDSECRITRLDRAGMDSAGPTTWTYRDVDDGLVVIKRSEFRNEVEAGSQFTKTKRFVEDGQLVKTVSWTQRGAPSRETPYEDDWIKVGKSLFYYDAEGRRIARVEYGDPDSSPPATPQLVNRYYYDCAWAE